MRSYIIIGNQEKRDKFIEEYIREEGISDYSITYYNEEVKIIDAKRIRHTLSRKYSEKYLIIINAGINQVAQNALLKSIEELSENISIIISTKDLSTILDTIKSRFFLSNLGNEIDDDSGLEGLALGNTIAEKMLFIDKFLGENSEITTEDQIDKFINIYRKNFLQNIDSLGVDSLRYHLFALKKLISATNLVKSNNLNLRLSLESSVL